MTLAPADRKRYVGFVNAVLPSSDYRVGFARLSTSSNVFLALPGRPAALPESQFCRIEVREGFSWRAVRELLRVPWLLRRLDADVAHFYASQFVLVGPLLARAVGVKSIITVTGMGRSFESRQKAGGWRAAVYRFLFALSASLSEWVLFQNEGDLDALAPAAGPGNSQKMLLIGSAIDDAVFDVCAPEPRDGLPLCLMVARVQRAKGVQDFLQAARELHGHADFALVGPVTPGEKSLVAEVMEATNEGLIQYHGAAADHEVRDWYRRANVVLLPSRTEGLPRVALEAGLSGRAVVAYAIPGCRAALPPSALVPVGDVEAFVARVGDLVRDQESRNAIAGEVHDWVETRFSLAGYVARLDSLVWSIK